MRLQRMLTRMGVPADVAQAIFRGLDTNGIARVRGEVEHLAASRSADHTAEGTGTLEQGLLSLWVRGAGVWGAALRDSDARMMHLDSSVKGMHHVLRQRIALQMR